MKKYKVKSPIMERGVILETGEIELNDKQAKRLIELGAIEEIEKSADDEKLEQLRERAKELGVPNASRMGEAKLVEAIAEKEEELQKQQAEQEALVKLREEAKALEIELAEDADADAIAKAIEAKKAEGGDV